MVLPIPCEFARASLSFVLLNETCNVRNNNALDEDCCTTLAKRVFGEICFAGLLVLSLVEAIVRAIFAIPGFFISLCCSEKNAKEIGAHTWNGALISLAVAYGSATCLIKNIYSKVILTVGPDNMPACGEATAAVPGSCLKGAMAGLI